MGLSGGGRVGNIQKGGPDQIPLSQLFSASLEGKEGQRREGGGAERMGGGALYFLEKGRLLPFGVHLTSTIALISIRHVSTGHPYHASRQTPEHTMLSAIMHNSRTSNMAGARRIARRE